MYTSQDAPRALSNSSIRSCCFKKRSSPIKGPPSRSSTSHSFPGLLLSVRVDKVIGQSLGRNFVASRLHLQTKLLNSFCIRLLGFLLRNSRKTECGAGRFLTRLVVRAAPFALCDGNAFHCDPILVHFHFGSVARSPAPFSGTTLGFDSKKHRTVAIPEQCRMVPKLLSQQSCR